MKLSRIALLFIAVAISAPLNAQIFHNLEFSGGWTHSTGNNGLDGFNVGTGVWFTRRVEVAFNFDHIHDTTALAEFALTGGLITTKNSLQNYLIGPRVFFGSKSVKILHTLQPFGEFQIGGSHLHSEVSQVGASTQRVSDNAGTWLLGGGGDVVFSRHWAGRINLDLLRTHFVDAGQSRLRIVFGVAYTMGNRKIE
jgi:hypothetical protein